MTAIEKTSAASTSFATSSSSSGKNSNGADASKNIQDAVNPTKVTLSQEGKALVSAEKKANSDTGYATMLSRLFQVTDPKSEPKVETKWTLASMQNPIFAFLNKDDRQTVAKAYQYAQDNNIDIAQVDNFAYDLSTYRDFQAEGTNLETLPRNGWNTDGSPRYYRMPDEDTKTATRILQSKEASQTSIDHGFIAFVLNPRGHGWVNENNRGHAVDFGFLEKLVKETSPTQENDKSDVAPQTDSSSIEPLYKNSLYWLDHQDIPDLPPEGWTPPSATSETAPVTPQVPTNEDLKKSYREGFLALLDRPQNKPKAETENGSDKTSNQTAHKSFAATQLEEFLKNEALKNNKT